jgi:hypothetical protein
MTGSQKTALRASTQMVRTQGWKGAPRAFRRGSPQGSRGRSQSASSRSVAFRGPRPPPDFQGRQTALSTLARLRMPCGKRQTTDHECGRARRRSCVDGLVAGQTSPKFHTSGKPVATVSMAQRHARNSGFHSFPHQRCRTTHRPPPRPCPFIRTPSD